MRRLLGRGAGLVRYVFTLRGLLIVLATALSLTALLADDLAVLVGSIAVFLWALILLLSGLRQADLNAAVGRLKKELGTVGRTPQVVVPTVSRPAPYGPSVTAPYAVEFARAALLATRNKLALSETQAQSRRGESDKNEEWRESTDPLVSVIVPCFNDARYLQDCLRSVIGQTFEDWECVVVDDGSLDHSAQVIASFANTDVRIRYVRHGVNAGLSAARNTGLRLARGYLVTFLDADDLLAPDSLLDRVEALQEHWEVSEVAGSFCGVRIGSEQTSASSLGASKNWKSPRPFVDFVNGADDCPFPVMAPLVRKSVVVGVGGFDESMRAGGEDWDLWLRILRAGFWFVPSSLRSAIYRQRSESMAKSGAAEHVRQGVALTKRAFGPENPPEYVTSHPFTEGLGKYQEQLSVGATSHSFSGDDAGPREQVGGDSLSRSPATGDLGVPRPALWMSSLLPSTGSAGVWG
jgi:GT2 family glycosyltransferase